MYLNNPAQEMPVCKTCASIRAPVVSTQQCSNEAAPPQARWAAAVLQGVAVKSNLRQALKIIGAKRPHAYHAIAFHHSFFPQVIRQPRECWWKESFVAKNRARTVAAAATPIARVRTTRKITEALMKTNRLACVRASIV